jgi:LysR family nitrogen assimilation transcriptional regulator
LIREFNRAMPEAGLTLREGLSQAMQESVTRGDLDLALVFDATPAPELELAPLGRYPLYLVGSDDHRGSNRSIPLSRVAELPLVIPSRPNVVRMELESQLAALGLKPDIRFEIDTIPRLLDLVREGLGVAVLPRISVHAFGDNHSLQLRRIIRPELTVTLYSVQSARRPMTPVQRNTIALIGPLLKSA